MIKKILGKNFSVKKFVGQKNFWVKKNGGQKKFWVKKEILVKNVLGSKTYLGKRNFR